MRLGTCLRYLFDAKPLGNLVVEAQALVNALLENSTPNRSGRDMQNLRPKGGSGECPFWPLAEIVCRIKSRLVHIIQFSGEPTGAGQVAKRRDIDLCGCRVIGVVRQRGSLTGSALPLACVAQDLLALQIPELLSME
jgi:hypothetical protein